MKGRGSGYAAALATVGSSAVTTLDQGESVYRESAGELVVRRMSPQLLATFAQGETSVAMVHWYIRAFHAFVDAAPRKVDIFHDFGRVTAFESRSRSTFAAWVSERKDMNERACRGVHILVESTLGFLATEVITSFTSSYTHAYRDRARFEQERQRLHLGPSTEPIVRGAAKGRP